MGEAFKPMKYLILMIALFCLGCGEDVKPTQAISEREADASCGLCHFGLTASACKLAVKIEEKAYFVKGVPADDHVKMHSPGGYCMTIRKAKVSGRIERGEFVALNYELLPEVKKVESLKGL